MIFISKKFLSLLRRGSLNLFILDRSYNEHQNYTKKTLGSYRLTRIDEHDGPTNIAQNVGNKQVEMNSYTRASKLPVILYSYINIHNHNHFRKICKIKLLISSFSYLNSLNTTIATIRRNTDVTQPLT